MYKKILSLLMVMIMAFSLTACGNTEVQSEVEGTPTPDATQLVEQEEIYVSFAGVVRDTNGNPLPNHKVELHSKPQSAVTDENGFVIFQRVKTGEHTLFVYNENGEKLVETPLVVKPSKNKETKLEWHEEKGYTAYISDETLLLEVAVVIGGEGATGPIGDVATILVDGTIVTQEGVIEPETGKSNETITGVTVGEDKIVLPTDELLLENGAIVEDEPEETPSATPTTKPTTAATPAPTQVPASSGSSGSDSHTHKYATIWSTDANNHWYASTCGHDVTSGKAAHTFTSIAEVPATCTTAGTTAGEKCTVCGYVKSGLTAIPALGHTEEVIPAVVETCTTDGATEGKKCTVCNETTKAPEVIQAKRHTYPETWTKVKEPTCKEAGLEEMYCTECNGGRKEQAITTLKDHTVIIDNAVAATCLVPGITEGSHCSECGTIIIAQTTVDALDHNYGEAVVNPEATCTTAGTKTFTCTHDNCGVSYTETIEALGHDWQAGTEVTGEGCANYIPYTCKRGSCTATKNEATGTNTHTFGETFTNLGDGTHGKVCTACSNNVVTDVVEHTWNEGTVTIEPGCITEGVKTFTCTATGCGATKTEPVSATGHSYTDNVVAPTCTTKGYTRHTCSVANCDIYYDDTFVAALGHDWEWVHIDGTATHQQVCQRTDCTETTAAVECNGPMSSVDNENHKFTCEACQTELTVAHTFAGEQPTSTWYIYTKTCSDCKYTEEIRYVAKVNDTLYKTIAEAVDAITTDSTGEFLISTADELVALGGKNLQKINVTLTTDIDLTDKTLTSIGTLTGTFDGQGHTISNLSTNLFGTVNGTVKNLNINNVTITNTAKNGSNGFISAVAEGGLVDNCKVSGVDIKWADGITDMTDEFGGVIGMVSAGATVQNCNFTDISVTTYVKTKRTGGVFNGISGTVKNCTINNVNFIVTSKDSSNAYITEYGGGFASAVNGGAVVENCTINNMKVTSDKGSNIGGIFGKVFISSQTGTITLKDIQVNGLTMNVGLATYTKSSYSNVGGFIGQVDSRNNDKRLIVENCDIIGLDMTVVSNKKGEDPSAGFIASLNGGADITNCSVSGKIDGTNEPLGVGGFLGCVGGYGAGNDYIINITNCYAAVTITGNDNIFVGGFVGYAGSYNHTMTKNLALNFANCEATGSFYGELETGTNEISTFTGCKVDGTAFNG